MRSLSRKWLLAVLLVISGPLVAAAQPIAASFDELPKVLRIGDVVAVIDKSGSATWGRVEQLSESSLAVAEMRRRPEDEAVITTGQRRVFTADNVARITRSDRAGREGPLVYPASWDGVQNLPADTLVTVALDTGEERTYRFRGLEANAMRLVRTDGGEERISQTQVRRVLRLGVSDSSANGLVLGALVGAGTLFVVTKVLYARCDEGCEAPAPSEMYPFTVAMGAGIGAGVGWLIDKVHRGTDQVFPAPQRSPRLALLPVVSARARGVRVAVTF